MRARLGALRAMFVFPGVQMSALGVAFVAAAASPGLAPVRALAIGEMSLAAPASGRHFARTRVIAASPKAQKPAPRIVTTQTPAPDAPPPPQHMEFGDDVVEGTLFGPEGEPIVSIRPAAQPSLIELRREFVPEMLKSLENF
jgi:hypothetical protein